jgi:hypothetical protein
MSGIDTYNTLSSAIYANLESRSAWHLLRISVATPSLQPPAQKQVWLSLV